MHHVTIVGCFALFGGCDAVCSRLFRRDGSLLVDHFRVRGALRDRGLIDRRFFHRGILHDCFLRVAVHDQRLFGIHFFRRTDHKWGGVCHVFGSPTLWLIRGFDLLEDLFKSQHNDLWGQVLGNLERPANRRSLGNCIFAWQRCFSGFHHVVSTRGQNQVEHIFRVFSLHALDHIPCVCILDNQRLRLNIVVKVLSIQGQNNHCLFQRRRAIHRHLKQLQITTLHIATGCEISDFTLGANHEGHVVVDTVDGSTEVLWLCPSAASISRRTVHVKPPHALQSIGCEEHGDAIRSDKRRDFVPPRVHPSSQGFQLAPTAFCVQSALEQIKSPLAATRLHACD